jgi:hypothetical protein
MNARSIFIVVLAASGFDKCLARLSLSVQGVEVLLQALF